MLVVAFTGMPGSGKGMAVEVANGMGFPVVHMGGIVKEMVRQKGLEMTNTNVGMVATEERKIHGYDIWAKRTMEKVRNLNSSVKLAIIDGTRGDAETKIFKESFKESFALVGIHAGPAIRFDRIMKRNREDDINSLDTFNARDARELSWGLGNAIAMADFMVVNDCSLPEFQSKIRILLENLVSKGSA